LALLANRPSLSLSGHTHTTEHHYLDATEGNSGATPHHHHVMTAVSGSWWSGPFDHRGVAVADSRDGSPNGFHSLSVDGNRMRHATMPRTKPVTGRCGSCSTACCIGRTRRFIAIFAWASFLDRQLRGIMSRQTDVVVNFFAGGPKTILKYAIDRLAPVSTRRVERSDPFVAEVFVRDESVKKPWVKAELSSHIWTARLPANLGVGTHALKVRAIDEYGREHRDGLIVELI
jgi:hypothetical protein